MASRQFPRRRALDCSRTPSREIAARRSYANVAIGGAFTLSDPPVTKTVDPSGATAIARPSSRALSYARAHRRWPVAPS